MFVWDVFEWNDQGEQWRVPATSVPFWDDMCGESLFQQILEWTTL